MNAQFRLLPLLVPKDLSPGADDGKSRKVLEVLASVVDWQGGKGVARASEKERSGISDFGRSGLGSNNADVHNGARILKVPDDILKMRIIVLLSRITSLTNQNVLEFQMNVLNSSNFHCG